MNGFKVTYIICSNHKIKLSYKLMNLKFQEACLRWENHAYTLVLLQIFALEQKFTKHDVESDGISLSFLKTLSDEGVTDYRQESAFSPCVLPPFQSWLAGA